LTAPVQDQVHSRGIVGEELEKSAEILLWSPCLTTVNSMCEMF
jgi:hypothetical protein